MLVIKINEFNGKIKDRMCFIADHYWESSFDSRAIRAPQILFFRVGLGVDLDGGGFLVTEYGADGFDGCICRN